MKNGILMIVLVTTFALAYLFGNRLSSEAAAVVAGAVCGITASIPVSLALFIAACRNWGQAESSREESTGRTPLARPAQAPVVISPPQVHQAPYPFQPTPLYMPQNALALGAPREFKIVGDD